MKRKRVFVFACFCVIAIILFVFFNFFVSNKKYSNFVLKYAKEYKLDSSLVYAIIKTESNFDKKAISKSGALGLMQIIPSTAKWIAEELKEEYSKDNMFDAETNIRYGCYYLSYLFERFKKMDIVVCAYNAGETVVNRWLDDTGDLDRGKIDYSETKNYLTKVESYYKVYESSNISIW